MRAGERGMLVVGECLNSSGDSDCNGDSSIRVLSKGENKTPVSMETSKQSYFLRDDWASCSAS